MANIGSVIAGKYKIERLIGKGGMSKVYLALDTRLGKHWAIKEVEKNVRDAQKNKVVTNSAISEANLIKGLDNYYLPRISDILDNGKTIYVVMDYVEGESLKSKLAREGAQSQDKVVKWGKQLCQVLHYLHTRKPPIIYRDMKPGNVMIKPDGDIKLIDFGIAREYTKGGHADTTSLGTRGYAAPEQFDAAARSDMRTDIYNLGATLYHAVTGHDPSKAPYEMKPIRSWIPTLSSDLEKVIKKCTNPDPKRRYQSVTHLMDALQRIGGGNEMISSMQDMDDGETTVLREDKPSTAGIYTPPTREKTVQAKIPQAPGIVRHAPRKDAPPEKNKVKPLYIVLPAVAVLAILIMVLALSAGSGPKDVIEINGEPQGISTLALSWEPSSKADGYEVVIAVDNPASYDNVDKIPPQQPMDIKEPGLVVGDLLCDETYVCEVRAYTDDKNKRIYQKGKSAILAIKTNAPNLSAQGVTAAAIGYDSVEINWEPVQVDSEEISCHLLSSIAPDGEYQEQYVGTGSAFVASGLVPETAYYYKVVAATILDGKEFTGESTVTGVTTGAVQLAIPTVKTDVQGYNSVKVTWSEVKVDGVKISYELQRSTKKDEGFKSVYSGGKRANTNTGLEASTRYYYKVIAIAEVSGNKYKAESKVVSAKTSERPVASNTSSRTTSKPRSRPRPNIDIGW